MTNTTTTTVTQILSAGGVEQRKANSRKMTALFKQLGGRVVNFGDKSADLEFPTREAAQTFVRAARAAGAVFESF